MTTQRPEDPTLPELTSEQEQLLRERFRQELLAEMAASGSADAVINDCIFTNMRDREIVLPDLGMRSGKDAFTPESFQPGEQKDLSERYTRREIRASKHLTIRRLREDLLPGRHQVDLVVDPFAVRAKANPDGTFSDPLYGRRRYDLKLQKAQEDEIRELGGIGAVDRRPLP